MKRPGRKTRPFLLVHTPHSLSVVAGLDPAIQVFLEADVHSAAISMHPAARSKSRNGLSNCGAIQATAGSASRSAVICRNSDAGSMSG